MKNSLRKIKREIIKIKKSNGINITKFLTKYLNIKNDKLNKVMISHDDVYMLFPNLERVSLDFALKNKELIYNGDILLIIDSYGNVEPYITPEIENQILDNDVEIEIEDEHKDKIKNVILDENLSRYELALLCGYYKRKQDLAKYRIVRDLLKIKKDEKSVEKFKNKKLELIMKGREEDD